MHDPRYSLLVLLLAGSAAAQGDPVKNVGPSTPHVDQASAAPRDRKQAIRLIRWLELPSQRAGAAPALLAMGARAVPSLIVALNDPRPEVICRLALILRALGPDARTAVPKLRELAKGPNQRIAFAAAWALSVFEPKGILLVSDKHGSIRELDEDGKVLFTLKDSRRANSVERLPNGNYLFCVYAKDLIREVDRLGRLVWTCKGVRTPTAATRLPSGHTLIASRVENKIIEVNPAGERVWSCDAAFPYSATRLNNGNTLIAIHRSRRLLEVNAAGERVWSHDGIADPLDAHRLANGNTLVASYTETLVRELTPAGKVVLKLRLPTVGWGVRRVLDGRTFVGCKGFLISYDASGKQLRKLATGGYITSIHLY